MGKAACIVALLFIGLGCAGTATVKSSSTSRITVMEYRAEFRSQRDATEPAETKKQPKPETHQVWARSDSPASSPSR